MAFAGAVGGPDAAATRSRLGAAQRGRRRHHERHGGDVEGHDRNGPRHLRGGEADTSGNGEHHGDADRQDGRPAEAWRRHR